MASFAKSLVGHGGHGGHGGHAALAAALARSAPFPTSFSVAAASRSIPVVSGLARPTPAAACIRLFSSASCSSSFSSSFSSRGAAARTIRLFSSSSVIQAQPAKTVATRLSAQRLTKAPASSAKPTTVGAAAAAAPPPSGRGVVRVGGGGIGMSAAALRQSLAEQLGRRTEPTLLYAAPSQFWYRLAGLLTGGFFLFYAGTTAYTVIWDTRPGLASWVPTAFALICGLMASFGIYFITSGRRLVQSIRAVPTAQLEAVAGRKKAAKALKAAGMETPAEKAAKAAKALKAETEKAEKEKATKAEASKAAPAPAPKRSKHSPAATTESPADETPIFLELKVGSVVPLIPARTLYFPPSAVFLPKRLSQQGLSGGALAGAAGTATGGGAAPATAYERVKARREAEEKQRQARQYEMDHLMTAPFRHLGRVIQMIFQQVQRAMMREGFLRLRAGGYVYRVDLTGGWALENGRALDRLVEVKNMGGDE